MRNESDSKKDFVLYSKRPEWSDIEPILQYDESKPRLIHINYEKECRMIIKNHLKNYIINIYIYIRIHLINSKPIFNYFFFFISFCILYIFF